MEKEIFKKLKAIEERLGNLEENYAKLADFILPKPVPVPKQIKDLPASVLSKKLSEFDLSARAIKHLSGANIHTVGDLAGYKKMDLLSIRNLGKMSLQEIEELLQKLGVSFLPP